MRCDGLLYAMCGFLLAFTMDGPEGGWAGGRKGGKRGGGGRGELMDLFGIFGRGF